MIQVKTMTEWPDEDYSYPLPNVSHLSEKKHVSCDIKGFNSWFSEAVSR